MALPGAGCGRSAAAMPLALPTCPRKRPIEDPRDTLKKRQLPAIGERVAGDLMGLLSSFACNGGVYRVQHQQRRSRSNGTVSPLLLLL